MLLNELLLAPAGVPLAPGSQMARVCLCRGARCNDFAVARAFSALRSGASLLSLIGFCVVIIGKRFIDSTLL